MGRHPNPTTISRSIPEGGTGQISEMETIGLYFYNARFYDPSLGRFVSADTLIPQPAPCAALQGCCAINPMAWGRYAYALNNPLRYTDPSGHETIDADGSNYRFDSNNPNLYITILSRYGVDFDGKWDLADIRSVYRGVKAVGAKFSSLMAGKDSVSAFKYAYGTNAKRLVFTKGNTGNYYLYGDCAGSINEGGCAQGITFKQGSGENVLLIRFGRMSSDPIFGRNNVVHELGHIMDTVLGWYPRNALSADSNPNLGREGKLGESYGFASPVGKDGKATLWQMNPTSSASEVFADMFLGWTFDTWEASPAGSTRSDWMNAVFFKSFVFMKAGQQ